ncbi:MAG TPA: ATP-binding protein, partial [Nannocystis sp.]
TESPARAGSLGLGLYISQQIARAHGGSVTVTSTPAHGTHFRVELPREAMPAEGLPDGAPLMRGDAA